MSMRDYVLSGYRFNLWFVKTAVEDVPEDQMAVQPKPGMNHAAWVLGHMAMERTFLQPVLKLELAAPLGWAELFMPGSTPVPDRSKYPSKEALLKEVEATHAVVEQAFLRMTQAEFEVKTEHELVRKFFPTIGDFVVGMLTVHAGVHVGQLSAWRRAMGLKSIF